MLKSYVKIAFRNLNKHKGYSFINIAGLALGMACSLFILLWVQDELSFDRFHAGAKALYRVEHDQITDRGKFHAPITPPWTESGPESRDSRGRGFDPGPPNGSFALPFRGQGLL